MVNGSNFSRSHTYGVGIFTSGSPIKIGELTADGTGAINNVKLEYPCHTLFVGTVSTEVYELEPDRTLGAGIASATTDGTTCL
jgi:hypothetical protein